MKFDDMKTAAFLIEKLDRLKRECDWLDQQDHIAEKEPRDLFGRRIVSSSLSDFGPFPSNEVAHQVREILRTDYKAQINSMNAELSRLGVEPPAP